MQRRGRLIAVAIAALLVGALASCGGDSGRDLQLRITKPGGISEQQAANLVMQRLPSSRGIVTHYDRERFTVAFPRDGDAARYRDVLTVPGHLTMRAPGAAQPALGDGDFFPSPVREDAHGRPAVLLGFTPRGSRRFRAFVRSAHGGPRSYVLAVDRHVVLRGTFPPRLGARLTGGFEALGPMIARDAALIDAVSHSGPLPVALTAGS